MVGDWTGDGIDKLGVFRAAPDGFTGEFILDTNNNRQFDGSDTIFTFGIASDRVVVGDWTGDKITKVGVFRDATSFGAPGAAVFTLDTNNNHGFDAGVDSVFIFGLIQDGLVVGDWNGDGRTKVGVYRDGAAGFNAPGTALFSLDSNGNLVLGHERVSLASSTPETDFELGYVTTFMNGALALQANAGYQTNVAGQSGLNGVTVLSRAKINF